MCHKYMIFLSWEYSFKIMRNKQRFKVWSNTFFVCVWLFVNQRPNKMIICLNLIRFTRTHRAKHHRLLTHYNPTWMNIATMFHKCRNFNLYIQNSFHLSLCIVAIFLVPFDHIDFILLFSLVFTLWIFSLNFSRVQRWIFIVLMNWCLSRGCFQLI